MLTGNTAGGLYSEAAGGSVNSKLIKISLLLAPFHQLHSFLTKNIQILLKGADTSIHFLLFLLTEDTIPYIMGSSHGENNFECIY